MKKNNSKKDDVSERASARAGRLTISGRYHRMPKTLEDDYIVSEKVLGSGYNGDVHMASSKQTSENFAVKKFKLHNVNAAKKEELETEAEIFLTMDHPHVARLTDVYESPKFLSLVMECMTGGELFDRVTAKKRFKESDAAEAARQMLLAINYIHSHGVVHRDIKLENFLYESKDSDHLKLIDFGFSKVWVKNTKMELSCGTLAYVAPEVLDHNYTSQCDLWSLGIIVFILLVGYMPFSGSEAKQIQNIKKGEYNWKVERWKTVSEVGADFVRQLLVVNPKVRLTASKALDHRWFVEQAKLERRNSDVSNIDSELVTSLSDFAKAAKFKRACMNIMAWSLTNEERAQVRQAFLELDENHQGTIKLYELKHVLEDKFHVQDEEVQRIFQALDTSHDDEIHYTEFLAAMVQSRIHINEDLLKKTFHRFDTDNSGYISEQNLKEVLGDTYEGESISKLLQEADINHDGKISYEEFIRYIKGGKGDDAHAEALCDHIDDHLIKNKSKQQIVAEAPLQSKAAAQANPPTVIEANDVGFVPANRDATSDTKAGAQIDNNSANNCFCCSEGGSAGCPGCAVQ